MKAGQDPELKIRELKEKNKYQGRICRNLLQSSSYRPNWRELVVDRWYHSPLVISAEGGTVSAEIPKTETDYWVKQLSILTAWGTCDRSIEDQLLWAYDVNRDNPIANRGSAIKAMLVAGTKIPEIAKRVNVPESYIQTYITLYFDVMENLDNQHYMTQIIIKTIDDRTPAGIKERTWMMAAWSGKEKTLDYIQSCRSNFTAQELAEINRNISNMLYHAAHGYMYNLGSQEFAPHMLEKLLAFLATQATIAQGAPTDHAGKRSAMMRALRAVNPPSEEKKSLELTNGNLTTQNKDRELPTPLLPAPETRPRLRFGWRSDENPMQSRDGSISFA